MFASVLRKLQQSTIAVPRKMSHPQAKPGVSVVLHVVDRTEGGVPAAVSSYITNSPPEFRHHILAPYANGEPAAAWTSIDVVHHELGPGLIARIRAVRRVVKVIEADVVHAHSSFSGVYARAAISRIRQVLVYTPHGYGFQRRDVSIAWRTLYWLAEAILSVNTTRVAACSPIEARHARLIPTMGSRILRVPNVSAVEDSAIRPNRLKIGRIGMAGRISAAKDPAYFIEVVRCARIKNPQIEAVWLGSGDPAAEAMLRSHGVRVTGWLSGPALVEELDALDLYVHTSAWESFPIAVLDAHARNLPILVRDIPAFREVETVAKINSMLTTLVDSDQVSIHVARNRIYWNRYLASNNAAGQEAALRLAWSQRTRRGQKE